MFEIFIELVIEDDVSTFVKDLSINLFIYQSLTCIYLFAVQILT